MKGLKENPCVGCMNSCLRIDPHCRPDGDQVYWKNRFEVEGFSAALQIRRDTFTRQDELLQRIRDLRRSNVNVFGEPLPKLPCDDMSTFHIEDCKSCSEYPKCSQENE